MTDALHHRRLRTAAERLEGCVAGRALADSRADLDQLMVGEGSLELADHAVRYTAIADHHQGVQGVRQAAQMFLLLLRQLHRPHYRDTTMPKRTKSSTRWLAEHASDEFVKRARAEGWRSRAVYKLAEIQASESVQEIYLRRA